MNADPQCQIQYQRAILDQDVAVALAPVYHLGALTPRRRAVQDGTVLRPAARRTARQLRATQLRTALPARPPRRAPERRSTISNRMLSPGASCPSFHRSAWITTSGQTNPPSEGPSGPRMMGMSPVKSTVADGVGVVVDVRGVQSRLAAIAPRPARRGSDQAHAGATGVVVHLPRHAAQHVDVFGGEEIRRAVRAVQHAQRPLVRDRAAGEIAAALAVAAAAAWPARTGAAHRPRPGCGRHGRRSGRA